MPSFAMPRVLGATILTAVVIAGGASVAMASSFYAFGTLGAGGIWNAGSVSSVLNEMQTESPPPGGTNTPVQVFRTGTCASSCSTYTNEAHDTDGHVWANYSRSTAYTKCKNYGTQTYSSGWCYYE